MSDYFYPEYELVIGGFLITEGVRIELQLDKEISFDWIIITWTEKLLHVISVSKDDEISLSIGYSGGLTQVFAGYVTDVEDLRVIGKNEMLKLNRTKIVNSFKQCTPEDVLTFILGESGVSDFQIKDGNTPIKKLYNVSNMSAMNVLKDINRFFGIEKSTNIFSNKKFEWNVIPPQDDIYSFVYAENIITLECFEEKCWELETVLVDGIKLLHKINVSHPKISGSFTVERIKYLIDENGFVRNRFHFPEV